MIVSAEEAAEIFYGAQNLYLKDMKTVKNQFDLEYVRTCNIQQHGTCRHNFTFNLSYFRSHFVRNIRMSMPIDKVDYVDLILGGQRIDRIYYKLYDVYIKEFYSDYEEKNPVLNLHLIPFPVLSEGIPLFSHHDVQIYVVLKKNIEEWTWESSFEIFADYYKPHYRNNKEILDGEKKGFEIPVMQSQFNGIESDIGPYRLNFNHPINMLVLEIPEHELTSQKSLLTSVSPLLTSVSPLLNNVINHANDEIEIILQEYENGEKMIFKPQLSYKINKLYVFKFDNYINFSIIDRAILNCNFHIPTITAIGFQPLFCMHGMGGMRFSK